ncbi:MAG: chloride transporter [Sphingobacteriia bacterium]|nr:chloride transporter [Sphingobacteriia bacterium]NCC39431.1 chloride transporter [Gammaproteobacteria bacterium]
MPTFALLDDCTATAARPTSRLYTDFVHECRCTDPGQLDAVWAEAEHAMRAGRHAVVLADYEWGARLLGAGDQGLAPTERGALRILLFAGLRRLSSQEVGAWLLSLERECTGADANGRSAERPPGSADDSLQPPDADSEPAPAGVFAARPSLDETAFISALQRIQAAIQAGETYQVNYTFRLEVETFGSPISLYRRLRATQPVPFGTLLSLPDTDDDQAPELVLSCSPELFLRHQAGQIQARPMKGTAARTGMAAEDARAALALSTDPKTRAENLMIVDLLRNDIGRLARIASVRVPALFEVEAHPTLWQMTSTIEATLRPDVTFADVLRATFPCGSITGAPKRRTMHWIRMLETRPRGLYTGTIGWIDPPPAGAAEASCGDFCLSVAIRTLVLDRAVGTDSMLASRPGRLGVGAGIVSDSQAADEYAESCLKARFLTGLDPGLRLLETMRASRADGIARLDRHLERLGRSADRLGFKLSLTDLRRALDARVAAVASDQAVRLRLTLNKDGGFEITATPLDPLPDGPVGLLIASDPIDESDPLLGHKTTHRARYDAAIASAVRQGAFDTIFHNRAGLLTEGGRSSIFLRLDGRWMTPPLRAGVLPGVMRATLLDDPARDACEAPLRLADLHRAERIIVCNALRGVLDARLLGPVRASG